MIPRQSFGRLKQACWWSALYHFHLYLSYAIYRYQRTFAKMTLANWSHTPECLILRFSAVYLRLFAVSPLLSTVFLEFPEFLLRLFAVFSVLSAVSPLLFAVFLLLFAICPLWFAVSLLLPSGLLELPELLFQFFAVSPLLSTVLLEFPSIFNQFCHNVSNIILALFQQRNRDIKVFINNS